MSTRGRVSGPSNFVSEWFGHRIYPVVAGTPESIADQEDKRCPFLSTVTGESKACVKPPTSSGVCTINSTSNGEPQDWLVCPYRALDPVLLDSVARRLFAVAPSRPLSIVPAPTIVKDDVRSALLRSIDSGGAGLVYLQDKLGGEISLSATRRSPEMSFDVTIVELCRLEGGAVGVGRYGILEVQTMDFHGSYRNVVKNLEDALRLHRGNFPAELRANRQWMSEKIEGPNIANVFKRTFYQMMLKFQIGTHAQCAGAVMAIPLSVWDSWKRHLGDPVLVNLEDGTWALAAPTPGHAGVPAWIYVFDVEAGASPSPNPIQVVKVIATDPESIAHYALKVAPDAALQEGGAADRVMLVITRRLSEWWPGLTLCPVPVGLT